MLRSLVAVSTSLLLALGAIAAIEPPTSYGTAHAVGVPAVRPMPRSAFGLVSDGRNFLALNGGDNRYGSEDVVAWRFDERGGPIDGTAIPVAATDQVESFPLAIWNGTDYAVFAVSGESVVRRRISKSGEVTPVGEARPWAMPFGGAWNGSRYGVALVGLNAMTLQYFDRDLEPTNSVSIGTAAEPVRAAAVATDGRDFLLVWETNNAEASRIYARLFDGEGRAIAGGQTLASLQSMNTDPGYHGSELAPVVSWNGARYLVAWTARDSVKATFVERSGLRGTSVSIPTMPPPASRSCAIAWGGTAHLIAWSDGDWKDTRGVMVTSTGQILDTVDFHAPSYRPAIASNGDLFLVIGRSDRWAVRSSGPERLSPLGPSGTSYMYQGFPTLTAGSTNLLTAWVEYGTVYASRIARDGSVLDGGGLELVAPASQDGHDAIVSASAGDAHMVGWNTLGAGVRVARVTASGEILDPGGTKIAEQAWGGNTPVLIGSSGSRFLIARLELRGGGQTLGIASVEPRGPIPPFTEPGFDLFFGSELHALLWTGSEYALLWRRDLGSCAGLDNCMPPAEEHLTTINEAGRVMGDITVPVSGKFVGASSDANGILVITSRNDSLISQRIGKNGSAAPEIALPVGGSVLSGSVVSTPGGFQLFYIRTANPPSKPYGYDSRFVALDRDGRALAADTPFAGMLQFGQAIRAFGATWVTYGVLWQFPDGSLPRSFFQTLPDRRRPAGRAH